MKSLLSLAFALFSLSALQCQTESNQISLGNPVYVEWVSSNGFRFMGETKPGEATIQASEILDSEGNTIPVDVNAQSFDITKYDFNSVIAPETNIIIKVSDEKSIFVYSRNRQSVLFNRYLTNQKAKK